MNGETATTHNSSPNADQDLQQDQSPAHQKEKDEQTPYLKSLTHSQYAESHHLAGLLKSHIRATGSFKEKLQDYAYVFARGQSFDANRAEGMIRSQFINQFGQSMNDMREAFVAREDALSQNDILRARGAASEVGQLITSGKTMPFYKAYDEASFSYSQSLGITQSKAKQLMQEQHREETGQELYDWGKDLEQTYHWPTQEQKQQNTSQQTGRTRFRARGR